MATAHLVGLRGSVWLERGRYEEAEGKYGQAVAHDRAGRTNVSVAQLCCAAYTGTVCMFRARLHTCATRSRLQ